MIIDRFLVKVFKKITIEIFRLDKKGKENNIQKLLEKVKILRNNKVTFVN